MIGIFLHTREVIKFDSDVSHVGNRDLCLSPGRSIPDLGTPVWGHFLSRSLQLCLLRPGLLPASIAEARGSSTSRFCGAPRGGRRVREGLAGRPRPDGAREDGQEGSAGSKAPLGARRGRREGCAQLGPARAGLPWQPAARPAPHPEPGADAAAQAGGGDWGAEGRVCAPRR